MILTREFLLEVHSCQEGYRFGVENNLIDGNYDDAIAFCLNQGKQEFADWLIEQKKTEYYVRNNGSIITMGAYQVFNPIVGQHTRYETEAEAKLALIEIAKEVLNQYCPTVVQELLNENGDTTWIPTKMNETLSVS
jgi:hypothetical protein